MGIGSRMRIFRESIGLTRDQFADQFQMSKSTLSGYELEKREPHADGLLPFIRAGASAHWLLTEEGPMMFVELLKRGASPSAQINVEALEAIIEGALKVAKNASPAAIAAHAARVYAQCIDEGLITADGVGEGKDSAAA